MRAGRGQWSRVWRSVGAFALLACLSVAGAGTASAGPAHPRARSGPTGATAPQRALRHAAVRATNAPPARQPVPPASSYVLVDAGTGNVLAAYDEHARLSPASLTKVLTALIAVRYLPSGAGVAGTSVSEHAYPNLAQMEPGVAWPLRDVLQAMLVYSANDAAYALAQRIGGSLAGFVPVMERSARQMGMTDHPLLRDPAGLDGSIGFEGGNRMSARDLAIAGRALLRVPELADIVLQRQATFVDPLGTLHALPSMNLWFLQAYPGAVGLKTGFTALAGNCIMAAATRHGRTMLAVVMKGYNMQQTAMDLLNQGFATPVQAEPTGDRLPPVRLPAPPSSAPGTGRAAVPAHGGVKAPHGTGTGKPTARTTSRTAGASHGQPAQRAPAVRPGTPATAGTRHRPGSRTATGLSAVLGSWAGRLLFVLSGLGALVALYELVRSEQLKRPPSPPRDGAGGPRYSGPGDLEEIRLDEDGHTEARTGLVALSDGPDLPGAGALGWRAGTTRRP